MTAVTAPPEEPRELERVLGERRAEAPGPTLIVVGGVHGNEPAGLAAAERVLDACDGAAPLVRGRFIALRGNLAALRVEAPEPWLRPRYIQRDLNRTFVDSPAEDDPEIVEQRERAELVSAIESIAGEASGPCVVVDLHTVSSDSPPFIAVEDSLAARRFALRFPLPKILGVEEELRGLLMDYATNRLGCVAMVVESGRHDDPRSVDVHEAAVRLALGVLGLCAPGTPTTRGQRPEDVLRGAASGRDRDVYDLRNRTPITSTDFEMHPDAEAFMPVRSGRTLVAVERGAGLVAPRTGLLFMPNRQPAPRVGDDGFFVIRRVGRVWLSASAWLRTRRGLHRWLPRVMPGVRTREGYEHDLLVAPEIAAVLRREVFHLLGYRLIRRTPTTNLPRRQRMRAGVGLLARSLAHMARGVCRGGERAALPDERDEDWIVRRRTLDVRPPPGFKLEDTS